jgi:hypothetical protein
MTRHIQTMELITRNALLIEKNKAFAEAMKAGRPHKELLNLYKEVKEIYSTLEDFREKVA